MDYNDIKAVWEFRLRYGMSIGESFVERGIDIAPIINEDLKTGERKD